MFKAVDKGVFWLSETPWKPSTSWGPFVVRTASYNKIVYLKQDKTFILINTHLDNRSQYHRINSVDLIKKFLAKYNTDNLDVLITGDFNEGIAQTTQSEFIKLGFNDSWSYCNENSCCSNKEVFMSFHFFLGNAINNLVFKPLLYLASTFQGSGFPGKYGYLIDWILYKGIGIVPEFIHLINKHDLSGIYSSDHFPLYACCFKICQIKIN